MSPTYCKWMVWMTVGIAGLCGTLQAADPADISAVQSSLTALDAWIGAGSNGDKWRAYLRWEDLQQQLAQGAGADPAVVARVLQQYRSAAPGLEKKLFVTVRQSLTDWLTALKHQQQGNLPRQVWAARGDHAPISDDRWDENRRRLRLAGRNLERALGGDTAFAKRWKTYLHWELLAPHFEPQLQLTGKSLRDLEPVLKRLRKNKPGLELPVFTELAAAIETYRELAFWYALGQRRDTRPRYEKLMESLEKQLARNLESPTVEATRQVGKLLGLMDTLGHSPRLVQAIRQQFSQPNVSVEISAGTINRLAARPVQETHAVRDCLLGAAVRGTAHSRGQLRVATLPAEGHWQFEVQLAGHIHSRTISYKKPVQVFSHGLTDFVASKRVRLSDPQFEALPAVAHASMKTHIDGVRKTGGDVGRRLIERVARQKVAERKALAERISARKTERKISRKFDGQVLQAITRARGKYDQNLRPPLIRVGMFPQTLRMHSAAESVHVEATLASFEQISTAQLPPTLDQPDDVTVQVHETAANNFLPVIFSGVVLRQDEADQPPRLEGEVPAWLRKLTSDKELQAATAGAGSEPAPIPWEDFKPWSFQLNADHPASVSFDDQQLTVRIRIAELKTFENGTESIRKNWDLLVTYQLIQDGGGLLIRRVGEVQALPTGFDPVWFGDPRWGDKLTSEQVSVRRILEKNLNKRAAAGQGFPAEIRVPPLRLPGSKDTELALNLQQFDCDDGWLTLGYRLP